jgi:hypothetical protein
MQARAATTRGDWSTDVDGIGRYYRIICDPAIRVIAARAAMESFRIPHLPRPR